MLYHDRLLIDPAKPFQIHDGFPFFQFQLAPNGTCRYLPVCLKDWGVEFQVESAKDVQITVQLEDDKAYKVFVDGVAVGGMKTNMSGKLNCSVELSEGVTAKVKIVRE